MLLSHLGKCNGLIFIFSDKETVIIYYFNDLEANLLYPEEQ